jgi:hypothetical protein
MPEDVSKALERIEEKLDKILAEVQKVEKEEESHVQGSFGAHAEK